MDIKELKRLIKFMQQHNVEELEIEEPQLKVHLRLGLRAEVVPARLGGIPPPSAPAFPPGAPPPSAPAFPPEENLVTVRAPIVGTFYRSPAPDKPPYVEEGSEVKQGQTLCVIEAMKLMNEIESPIEGVVVSIQVANAEAVEFDESLMTLRPKS